MTNHATPEASSFAEVSALDTQDSATVEQVSEVSVSQAIATFKLVEARANAESAEFKKRLVMQQFRPCKIYPVLVYHDGLRWVCEYASMRHQFQEYQGTDAAAYGMSPEEAMQNFDKLWTGMNDADEESEEEREFEDEDV